MNHLIYGLKLQTDHNRPVQVICQREERKAMIDRRYTAPPACSQPDLQEQEALQPVINTSLTIRVTWKRPADARAGEQRQIVVRIANFAYYLKDLSTMNLIFDAMPR